MNKTIFKMAMQNLFANKTKTIIITTLIGVGTMLVVLGLGVLNFGLKQTKEVAESDFSGEVFITGKSRDEDVIPTLFGPEAKSAFKVRTSRPKMPYLPNPEKITAKLDSMDEVKIYTKSVAGSAFMLLRPVDLEDNWQAETASWGAPNTLMLGIEPDSYKKMFDTIKITEGIMPDSDAEPFVLISNKIREDYEKYYKRPLKTGDEVLMMTFTTKIKIRKVRVSGFFNFAHPDSSISHVTYTDHESARLLSGMTKGAQTAAKIPENIDLTLSEKSENELFGGDDDFIEEVQASSAAISESALETILGSTELRDKLNIADNEAWNHITVKLNNPSKTAYVIKELNKWFAKEEIEAAASDWETAMHQYARAMQIGRKFLIVVLVVLAIVVFIVIMNTLVVAVMERTGEIGTMRAIGAKRSFVKKIFYTESLLLSCSGAMAGIALAFVIGFFFNLINVRLSEIPAALLGGYSLKVSISFVSAASTLFAMAAVGIAANWYPVSIALRVSPLEAMNK